MGLRFTLGMVAESLEHICGLTNGPFCFLKHIEKVSQLAKDADFAQTGCSCVL
jgi:hypothetical protein